MSLCCEIVVFCVTTMRRAGAKGIIIITRGTSSVSCRECKSMHSSLVITVGWCVHQKGVD